MGKIIKIVTTRFSNNTWKENMDYLAKNKDISCIYGSPQEMSPKILYDSTVFVIEMNNNVNQIEGIGLVKNRPFVDKYYSIYSEGNYNRFVYKSNYRIDRETILRFDPTIVDILEYVVFKEKSHLKRGSGFTTITQELLKRKKNEIYKNLELHKIEKTITACFKSVFHRHTT
jgi:hypothetical protein